MSAPMVPQGATIEIAPGVHVVPDQRIEFVPNAGIVVGDRAALVIETAMGPANGERILREARRVAGDLPLVLTTTHFHPEHAFGAQAFAGAATYVCNRAQAEELADKGREYVEMFSGFGPALEELLRDVELVAPHVVYGDEATIDLGGIAVELRHFGTAHTRGDQVAFIPDGRILFTGDLVEERFLPIFPDEDADGPLWLGVLDELEALEPAVVVPGHGAVGDRGLIVALREYLHAVRDGAQEAELADRYADWGNQMWIMSAIESFARARAR